MSNSPVVFFVFKRPKTTKLFLDLIKGSGTKKIFIFADEGRDGNEKQLSSMVREIINSFARDNKDITIIPNFAKENLGLKKNIIEGLTHVFAKEDRAIIIEDDCLPHPDFFRFANDMLRKYEDNNQIMSITGTSAAKFSSSYSFTRYQQCWGWATWRRAWQLYDPHMKQLSSSQWQRSLTKKWPNPIMRFYWRNILEIVAAGRINTWDFQWSFAHFINNGLAIMPAINLIENIGFDSAATNTKIRSSAANMRTASLSFPLIHPKIIGENIQLNTEIEKKFYSNPVAYLGMIRQYFYWTIDKYVNRN